MIDGDKGYTDMSSGLNIGFKTFLGPKKPLVNKHYNLTLLKVTLSYIIFLIKRARYPIRTLLHKIIMAH